MDHVDGHPDHGGQRQQQADEVAPPRVVVAEVRQRHEVDQVEQEDALWGAGGHQFSVKKNKTNSVPSIRLAVPWNGRLKSQLMGRGSGTGHRWHSRQPDILHHNDDGDSGLTMNEMAAMLGPNENQCLPLIAHDNSKS